MSANSSAAGSHPTSVAEWFRRRAIRDASAPALSFEGQHWRYGELQAEVEPVRSTGGGRRDRVACLGFNHPITPITLMAASRLGAIFVQLNFRLSAEELRAVIADADVHSLIADDHHAALGRAAENIAPNMLTC